MTVEGLRTPAGRIVWGDPSKPQIKKDQRTKQPIMKDGKPVEQWAFGVAFSKADFNAYLKPYFDQEAYSAYPNGVPSNFSWKYKDGDSVDRQGKLYSAREGYGGCMVVNISTEAFAPQIFKHENGAYRQISPEEIKCGDYVVLSLNLKVNVPRDPTHTPGLYVNPNGIEHVGYGPAIQSSANPDEMFGGVQHQLPPGASAVPVSTAPAGQPMPTGYAPQPQPMPAGYPAPQPAPGYPAQQPPQPAYAPQPGYPAQQPQPQYQQPQQPAYAPQPQPMPAPAHDFVQPAPGYAPQPQQSAYAPQPQPGYPAQQQPAPAYAPQPQQPGYPAQQPMPQPGMMPSR